jgi:hypothetical protein
VSRRTVEDWRRAAYRSHLISDPVRVLLLWLADHARQDMTVSVPRDRIAKALNKSERRIAERFRDARDAGFLFQMSAGYRGHTSVFRCTFPDVERVTPTSTLSSAETRTLSPQESVTPGGHAITTADLSLRGTDRNVARDEREACRWHGQSSPCPSDCADHPTNRQESA